eukprot:TRINITY_DN3394_c0_g1_i3.p1 TRINITY_DN3394_c0_g1~~TRINITY_DN3394_c0_g1_i3.p1  ORF type:complete len:104 (-),score=10.27 TRINITY_DN3394_c0_g1_i3:24-335(-)
MAPPYSSGGPAQNARATREVRNLKSSAGKSNVGNETGRHVDFGGVMLFSNTSPLAACAVSALPRPADLPTWRVFPPDIRTRQAEIGRAVQQECRDRSRMPSSA